MFSLAQCSVKETSWGCVARQLQKQILPKTRGVSREPVLAALFLDVAQLVRRFAYNKMNRSRATAQDKVHELSLSSSQTAVHAEQHHSSYECMVAAPNGCKHQLKCETSCYCSDTLSHTRLTIYFHFDPRVPVVLQIGSFWVCR